MAGAITYAVWINVTNNQDVIGQADGPKDGTVTPNKVCSDSLIKEADKVISGGTADSMGKLASEVKSIKNYDSDPNCLFIVISESIAQGNSNDSKQYFDKLAPLVRSQGSFSELFTKTTPKLDSIDESISVLESNDAQLEQQLKAFDEGMKSLDEIDRMHSEGRG